MNEFEVHNQSDEKILNRIKNIDWHSFYLQYGQVISKDDIDRIGRIYKFRKFKDSHIIGTYKKPDGTVVNILNDLYGVKDVTSFEVKTAFYFYDPSFTTFNVDAKDATKTSILYKSNIALEQEAKGIFYVNQRCKDLKMIFDAVDNQAGDVDIDKSRSLRAKKYKMIESFYDDACKLFLTLIMDYIYDCSNMELNGEDIQDQAVIVGRLVLNLMNKYDEDLKGKIGGDNIYNEIKEEIPNPVEKKEKTVKKKSTKKKSTKKEKKLTVE